MPWNRYEEREGKGRESEGRDSKCEREEAWREEDGKREEDSKRINKARREGNKCHGAATKGVIHTYMFECQHNRRTKSKTNLGFPKTTFIAIE